MNLGRATTTKCMCFSYVVMVSAKVPMEGEEYSVVGRVERTRKEGSQSHMEARDGGGLRAVTTYERAPLTEAGAK